jgi:hypothetical protein
VRACYKVTEEQYAFAHHCGSLGRRFWSLCYGLNHRLACEFTRDETDQHTFTRQRGALLGALPSRLVLASSVRAPLLVTVFTR